MIDSVDCQQCGGSCEPVFSVKGKLKAWLCDACLWFDAPTGREFHITKQQWEKNNVRTNTAKHS